MSNFSEQQLLIAHESALKKWAQPNKLFASGLDVRSSENALLTQLYGGLILAESYGWQNAGRRLIDKTYINILLTTQNLSSKGINNSEQIAAELDSFIRDHLAHIWSQITSPHPETQHQLAFDLLNIMVEAVFKSNNNLAAASYLMFYLCPTLPVIPYSKGHIQALQLSELTLAEESFSNYSSTFIKLVESHTSFLDNLQIPHASFGSEKEIIQIDNLLGSSNWWSRRVILEALSLI